MIAIVYPQFYGVGGIARYLDSFLANLPPNRPTIYVITGNENRVDKSYINVEFIHLPIGTKRFGLFFWALKARKIINQLYTQKKIQCVNLHIPPLIPGLFIPKHIPLFVTAHTTYWGMSGRFYKTHFFKSQWNKAEVYLKLKIEKQIFNQAVKVITLTEQGCQELRTYDVNKPISVIANGVDAALFTPNLDVLKDIDILFCGRIEQRKGSRSMVDVCKFLVQQKNDITILIVGYGEDDEWVSAQLRKFPKNITLTGKVSFSQAQYYYSRSKIYLSTSYYEGLPGTCLEAMAMGLPVVVWEFLFYKDLVKQDENGYLVKPNNIPEFASSALKLLNDERLRVNLAINARKHIEVKYNWSSLSPQILEVITL